ncbi:hypothetical protein OGM63_02010 [Plectonema radiosum NIES-515]|uniref:Uncharacterized protein n=1 Tax=Plectonema radiosum NIES-515 TaxID=2986073 RepID=A0ABT3AT79_9CYAN|nr:hypothetical protein [Plectonema radiosum]MCV3212314.1 hypothetical protein [Plectonema radiosum NIES-515]
MSVLQISDLSFCEVVEKEIEVQGGAYILAGNIKNENLRSLITRSFSPSLLVEYDRQPLYSTTDIVVDKLQNQITGESGYLTSSKDGKYQSGVIVGQNSVKSFASYISSST